VEEVDFPLGTDISTFDFSQLNEFSDIRILAFSDKGVNDSAILGLNLTELREVYLGFTDVSDRGVNHLLESSPNLEFANLSQTLITDSTLKKVAESANLTSLIVSHTDVSFDGIVALLKKRPILDIDVTGTDLTASQLQRLQKQYSSVQFHDD